MSPETAAALQQGLAEHGGEIAPQGNEMGNSIVDDLHKDTRQVFAASVIELSRSYLGRGALLSDKWKKIAQRPEPMLSDMLAGGIYGSKSRSRMHSASVTLGAVESTRQGKRSGGVKEALFPPRERLAGKYTVLKKHPWLLPAVWIVRLVGYAAELASGKGSRADESVMIARKRTELLKPDSVLFSALCSAPL